MTPAPSTLPKIFQLHVTDVELAYLILQVDASLYVAGVGPDKVADPDRAAWYLKELTAVTKRYVELHGIDGLKALLDRMYRLTGLER